VFLLIRNVVANELNILKWLESVVAETQTPVLGVGTLAIEDDQDHVRRISRLDEAALLIWVQLFDNSNGVWPFFQTIGASLKRYREML